MNSNNICVFDFESDSPNPQDCQPVQLGALMVHPYTLTVIENSEFNSMMRPADIDNENYYVEHQKTIEWHAKNQKKTAEEVFNEWKAAPPQKIVWQSFTEYLEKYNSSQSRKTIYTSPLACGYNILGFDCLIIDRLAKLYGNIGKDGRNNLFFGRDKIDIMLYCFIFFEGMRDPSGYSMDVLREFLGINPEGGHDALKDVKDTAEIFIRFQKLARRISAKTKFRNSFKTPEENILPKIV